MKKILLFILIMFFVFPFVSSLELAMDSNFSKGETLIASVSGTFIEPISEDNVFFYRTHVKIPVDFEIVKIQDEIYIYAQLSGKTPGNYSLSLENIKYRIGAETSEEPVKKEFTITEEQADFSVSPGAVFSEADFSIDVQNLQANEITISYLENSLKLKSGEKKKLNLEAAGFSPFVKEILEISSNNTLYEIPVYISTESKTSFLIDPLKLNISLSTKTGNTRILTLYNTGEETIKGISLTISDSLKDYVSLSEKEIKQLEKDASVEIELKINSDEEIEIQGTIEAKTEDLTASSMLYFNFIDDFKPEEQPLEISIQRPCSEQGGRICSDEETCKGEKLEAKDGICCLGQCTKASKSNFKIIGIVILVAIVLVMVWFYLKKYKKVKKPVDLLKISKGK